MTDICSTCGLPKELCVCDVLEKEAGNIIKVYIKKSKFNKPVTVVDGIPSDDIEDAVKELKRRLACGGTVKENRYIELQGNHKSKIKAMITSMGYKESDIDVA